MAGSGGATDGGGGAFNSVTKGNTTDPWRQSEDDVWLPRAELSGNRLYEIYDFMDAGPDEWENGQGK